MKSGFTALIYSVTRMCGLACILAAAATIGCAVPSDPNPHSNNLNNVLTSTPEATADATPSPSPTPPIAAENPEFDVSAWFDQRAQAEDGETHAVIIASMDPGRTIARQNPDAVINPASLVKLATSLVALKELGSDHRFEMRVNADGILKKDGLFEGDLYFSGSNPVFEALSAKTVADAISQRGIKHISGKVYVSPDFSYAFRDSAEDSAELFAKTLGFRKIAETAVADKPKGEEILTFRSQPLDEVLFFMNSVSQNFVAHRIADKFGGPERIRQFLVQELKLPEAEVKLETASGLGDNGMTPRGIFAVIRELEREISRQGLKPVDIMPIATEPSSTLARRLRGLDFEPAIIAKTGTLSARDGGPGIGSLAGIAYGKDGPIVFVLMSRGENVGRHKKMHDELLKEAFAGRAEPVPFDVETPRDLLKPSDTEIVSSNDLKREGR